MQTSPDLIDEIERFRATWISEVEKCLNPYRQGLAAVISAWEGREACRELTNAGELWIVYPDDEPEFKEIGFPFLTSALAKEIHLYREYADKIIPTNLAFKDSIGILAGMQRKLESLAAKNASQFAGIPLDLKKCSVNIAQTKTRLEGRRKHYWKNMLFGDTSDSTSWPVIYSNGMGTFVPPSVPLAGVTTQIESCPYPQDLLRRIDLDRHFQVRVAFILRGYFFRESPEIPNAELLRQYFGDDKLGVHIPISFQTIVRLTVLTYLAGKLGHDDTRGNLIVTGRTKPITVANVAKKLQRIAGLK